MKVRIRRLTATMKAPRAATAIRGRSILQPVQAAMTEIPKTTRAAVTIEIVRA
jgi:hypothetical protein